MRRLVLLPQRTCLALSDARLPSSRCYAPLQPLNGVRLFSSEAKKEAEQAVQAVQTEDTEFAVQKQDIRAALVRVKDQLFSPLGVASMATIGATALAYKVTMLMSSLSIDVVARYSFLAGLCAAGAAGAAGFGVSRYFLLRPQALIKQTLNIVQQNKLAVFFLGGNKIKMHNFSAVHRAPAPIPPVTNVTYSGFQPEGEEETDLGLGRINRLFPSKIVHLIFTVTGAKGKVGVVCAEVEKRGNAVLYRSLYIIDAETGERLVLEGPEDKQIMENTLKLLVKN